MPLHVFFVNSQADGLCLQCYEKRKLYFQNNKKVVFKTVFEQVLNVLNIL